MLHVCFILHFSLHDHQEKNTCTGKTAKIEPQNTFVVRASDFWNFWYSFTVKKVNFFTINIKFKVTSILSSKSGGGGDICTGHPRGTQVGGGGGDTSPHPPPPGIYASGNEWTCFSPLIDLNCYTCSPYSTPEFYHSAPARIYWIQYF